MRRKRDILYYTVTIFCCLLALTVLAAGGLLIYRKVVGGNQSILTNSGVQGGEHSVYTQEEVDALLAEVVMETESQVKKKVTTDFLNNIRLSLEGGKTILETLRPMFPEYLVVVSGGKYNFVPIRHDLKKHNLEQEKLEILEDGEYQYVDDEVILSYKGIDVSKYQGDINWEKVAASGVEYAFVRVGLRGYGAAGKIVMDETYKKNIEGALAAGVDVGVYFFTQAVTEAEALEEANVVLDAIKGYDITYPIVFDVEKTTAAEGRMNQLTVEERTKIARVFLDRIKEAGYTPMIYANMEMWTMLIDMAQLEDVEKWYAYYGTELYLPYEFAIWQYTDSGRVPGIDGEVDMNISFKKW